jgi:uncharacterized protein with PIN domain
MVVCRFAVDRMLGRLATWLRLIGQDATYGAHLSGRTLERHARTEGRTILTRDHRLLRAASDVSLLFIESDHFRDQLRQVVRHFGLDPFACVFTRCSRCNHPVVTVPKAQIAGHVPDYVFATQLHFVRCLRCGRIYWPATHHALVYKELQLMGFSPTSAPETSTS